MNGYSCTGPKLSTMTSSGQPHKSSLRVGCTILAVSSVPLNSVGHLTIVSFIDAHVVSASQGEDYIAIGCDNGICVSKRGANCESSKILPALVPVTDPV